MNIAGIDRRSDDYGTVQKIQADAGKAKVLSHDWIRHRRHDGTTAAAISNYRIRVQRLADVKIGGCRVTEYMSCVTTPHLIAPSQRLSSTHEQSSRKLRSSLTMSFDSIPVLDLSLARDAKTKPIFLQSLRSALLEVGFLYIKNTGISDELVEEVITQGKAFFSIPNAKKLEVQMKNAPSFLGT